MLRWPRNDHGIAVHRRGRRHALLEHHHDALATTARGENIDAVSVTGPRAQEDADGIHLPGLENIRRGEPDPAPQATPLAKGSGHDLLGLARYRGRALPLADFDGLSGRTVRGKRQQQASEQSAT